jgi:ribosomal protein S18 acetylase RimI-like enzyme
LGVSSELLPQRRSSERRPTALLDAVEARLAALGVDDMTIDVVAGNTSALRLYERRGPVRFVVELTQRVGWLARRISDGLGCKFPTCLARTAFTRAWA